MGTFRFLLAFLVAFGHTALEFPLEEARQILMLLPISMAIQSFFVISGFIIILTLNKNYYTGDSYLRQSSRYYLNRILRIFPLYILSVLFFYLDVSLLNIIHSKDSYSNSNIFEIKYILSNLLLIFQDSYFEVGLVNPVAWSLDLELQWYLFAPVLYYFFYYKYNAVYLRIIVYTIILLIFFIINITQYFLYFVFGILLYDFYIIYQSKLKNAIKMRYVLILSTLLLFSYPIFNFDFLWYTYWLGIALLCFTVNFKHRIDKLLGDLSYPIFVLHIPVIFIVFLQVNKYCKLLFGITFEDYFMLVSLISFIFFVVFCYFILLVIQYPLDHLRNKIKSDSVR